MVQLVTTAAAGAGAKPQVVRAFQRAEAELKPRAPYPLSVLGCLRRSSRSSKLRSAAIVRSGWVQVSYCPFWSDFLTGWSTHACHCAVGLLSLRADAQDTHDEHIEIRLGLSGCCPRDPRKPRLVSSYSC